MIVLFAAGIALFGWCFYSSGLLRRIGLLTVVLSGVTALAALVLAFAGSGVPPILPLLCALATGIGLAVKRADSPA